MYRVKLWRIQKMRYNNEFKKVNKEEFYDFLVNYNKKHNKIVDVDINAIGEPPFMSFNDHELGEYPDSMVAYTYKYYDVDPNDLYYTAEEDREYYIREDTEDEK